MHPADFYTGIVADLYKPLKSTTRTATPYIDLIEKYGEPALELGCGDGEPLLDLRRHGIDVEGVDSSADMLDRCRREAADEGLAVTVHHQKMETLDLPRRYRTVFLAGPTFNLLPDDGAAQSALRSIRAHLSQDGIGLIPLFIPSRTPRDELGRLRETQGADGAVLRFAVLSEERNETARTQQAVLRYERHQERGSEVIDRPWLLHWYTQQQFRDLAAAVGLRCEVIGNSTEDPDEFTFLVRRG